MEHYYLQTIGQPIVTPAHEFAGRVRDVVIKPETGKIMAFSVFAPGHKVVSPIDILSWEETLEISDKEDIVDAHEIHHVQELLKNNNLRIHKKPVRTKNGEYIGNVIDFAMDTTHFTLTKLVVAKGFLGLIFWDRKLIHAQDIIEIKPKEIIIKEPLKPIKMEKFQVDMATP